MVINKYCLMTIHCKVSLELFRGMLSKYTTKLLKTTDDQQIKFINQQQNI